MSRIPERASVVIGTDTVAPSPQLQAAERVLAQTDADIEVVLGA